MLKNNYESFFKIGLMYEKGNGVEQDLEKAFQFYKIAAENNISAAQLNLAILYNLGEGVEQNIEQAVYWYKKRI